MLAFNGNGEYYNKRKHKNRNEDNFYRGQSLNHLSLNHMKGEGVLFPVTG